MSKKAICILIVLIIASFNIYSNNNDRSIIGIKDVLINNSSFMHTSDSIKSEVLNRKSLILTYKQKDITIMWVDSDTTNIDKYTFAYKLEGYDREWIFTTYDRKTRYTNLDAGSYMFKVRYAVDGIWNENFYDLKIMILPTFWQTWWFKILVFIVFILIISLTRKRG